MGRLSSAVAVVSVLAGCAPLTAGTFDANGFQHLHYEYRVNPAERAEILPGWTLENYQTDADGRPSALKVGPTYARPLRIDVTGDGKAENFGDYPVDDLRFRSRRTAGVIWLRSMVLPYGLAQTELRVLGRLYVDAVSGSGLETIELRAGHVTAVSRRFATRDVETAPLAVDGREAFRVTFEIANVDQAQAGADARWERVRLVLIRSDLDFGGTNSNSIRTPEPVPMLLVAGYSNLPEDFDHELDSFESFVARIRFDTTVSTALREGVLRCVPNAEVVPFVVRPGFAPLLRRSLWEHADCISHAVEGTDLGAVRDWRSFAPRRSAYTVPAAVAAPPANPAAPP